MFKPQCRIIGFGASSISFQNSTLTQMFENEYTTIIPTYHIEAGGGAIAIRF
jgi:hypothetical protein